MRALIISAETQQDVARVRTFASKPENYYIVGAGGLSWQRPPGDDPRHVAHIPVGYRCVFSMTYTKTDAKLWRHLSISVPVKDKYPHQVAAFTIAAEFGFTGWDGSSANPPGDWVFQVNRDEHCVVLAQDVTA